MTFTYVIDALYNESGLYSDFLVLVICGKASDKPENAETSAEIINSSLLDVPDIKINNDQLFDEVVLAKEYLQSNWEQWKQEDTPRDVIISVEEKWLRLFGHFKENHIAAPNLIKIVKYAFCLPGTSAPVERVLSLMNNAWTDDRGLMKESTVKGLMTYKINIGLACEDFYIKIKNEKKLSKKILANEKYM
ncbi:hypothetical protein AVEN_188101-1 [Araneus ventricosus]|uniref:HAT C-terminal dimerisation domain-containing protein n=1 Tax=Araneus ventricosus TaxID=182803 RepID=A0A4Y2KA46_ARAVE|nr:hypothetical protein AVEN_188101-1 [Araneus ventricosus]